MHSSAVKEPWGKAFNCQTLQVNLHSSYQLAAGFQLVWKSVNVMLRSRWCWEERTFPGQIKKKTCVHPWHCVIRVCVCVCAELLMAVIYEACEQAVCAASQTARLVRTNEGSVCVKPQCWPLLCSLLPWSTFICSALQNKRRRVARAAGSRSCSGSVERDEEESILLCVFFLGLQ